MADFGMMQTSTIPPKPDWRWDRVSWLRLLSWHVHRSNHSSHPWTRLRSRLLETRENRNPIVFHLTLLSRECQPPDGPELPLKSSGTGKLSTTLRVIPRINDSWNRRRTRRQATCSQFPCVDVSAWWSWPCCLPSGEIVDGWLCLSVSAKGVIAPKAWLVECLLREAALSSRERLVSQNTVLNVN